MKRYKTVKKCALSGCKVMIEDKEDNLFCKDHNTPAKRRLVNNAHGYNQFKPNPEPENKPLTAQEVFNRLDKLRQVDELSKLGNVIYTKKSELKKLNNDFTIKQKILFGWKHEKKDD